MNEVARFIVVRDKTEHIAEELLYPGPDGHYFPKGLGARVVYLDSRYNYPEATSTDFESERARQSSIWRQVMSTNGSMTFLEKAVEDDLGLDRVNVVRDSVAEIMGSRNTAEFFERVFSDLFAESLEVVVISTGITHFGREAYHDIGCLRTR